MTEPSNTSPPERPLCKCHGEPMVIRGDGTPWRCRVKHRALSRRWREANPEKNREIQRRWREANPEKAREAKRRWREANPEKAREANSQRIRVGGLYLGRCGFTQKEREAILGPTE